MTRAELRNKAARKLNDVLRALILEQSPFPLPIRIAKPKTSAPLAQWRETISLIRSQSKEQLGYGYTVTWETINSRRHGKNDFPSKLSFACANDYFKYLGAEQESERVLANVAYLCEYFPTARPWCAANLSHLRKPNTVLQNALKLLNYFKANPQPGLYARQLPVQVPSKFFEQERALLKALIQAFAPECLRQDGASFEDSLGLMAKESLIEFRCLDATSNALPFRHAMATAKELAEKANYFVEFQHILIVENHVSFLTLPDLAQTLAIMGNGFAVNRLSEINWLQEKRLLYWGDIDLSGFAILAKLRESHPRSESIMMDAATFEHFADKQNTHQAQQVITEEQLRHLSSEEQAMVEELKSQPGLRLEQEHIDYSYAKQVLLNRIERLGKLSLFI